MPGNQNDVVELIRRSLASCASAGDLKNLPTFLIPRPYGLESWSSSGSRTSADMALAYYCCHGLSGDRSRKNLFGYPGLLRKLSSPPPWVEVEPRDSAGDISPERAVELRPLVLVALQHSEESLVAQYQSERNRNTLFLNEILGHTDSVVVQEIARDSFRQCVSLGTCLGAVFDAVYDAVFFFDEFTVADGAPDLLLWQPEQPSMWFFSEVKAPGDSLSASQKGWLREHWELVRGHYSITLLE